MQPTLLSKAKRPFKYGHRHTKRPRPSQKPPPGMLRPAHHADDTRTLFQNPWAASKSLLASGQVILNKFPLEFARRLHDHPAKPIQVVSPTFGSDPSEQQEPAVKATWLGHAGFMVEMPRAHSASDSKLAPTRLIFDPIWSERASPSQWAGPKRRLPPPCALEDLPEFHYVVTSHNHYDHLDWPTVERIFKQRGDKVHYVVPLGNKHWFLSGGIPDSQITELDWWDEVDLPRPPAQSDDEHVPRTKIVCCPAQHGSGRGVHDQRVTLWASWVVKENGASVYFAGDTGYMTETGPCPAFREIGQRLGPFDLAMLPIWRGGSLSWVASLGLRLASTDLLDGLHASPAHALALHRDIRSRHSLGMHFATFAGSDVEALEPVVELSEARDRDGVGDWMEEGGFGWIDVGATATIPIGNTPSNSDDPPSEK